MALAFSFLLGIGMSLGRGGAGDDANVPVEPQRWESVCPVPPSRSLAEPRHLTDPPESTASVTSAISGCPVSQPGIFAA